MAPGLGTAALIVSILLLLINKIIKGWTTLFYLPLPHRIQYFQELVSAHDAVVAAECWCTWRIYHYYAEDALSLMTRATKSQYSKNFSAVLKVHETSTNKISRSESQIIRSKKVKIYH